MEEICKNCKHLNEDDLNKWNEAYCTFERMYKPINDTCPYFASKYNCYLTTAMCHILGYSDDCYILEALRGFRRWYLNGNPDYEYLLDEYNIIGPIISKKLISDPDGYDVANMMKNDFITPAISFMIEERYEEATHTYIDMTNILKDKYDVCEYRKKTLIKSLKL